MTAKLIRVPTSKSVAQRAIAAALLSDNESIIHYPDHCNDTAAALRLARLLGAEIIETKDSFVIKGGLKQPEKILNAGESGLSLRMFSSIAALLNGPTFFSGEGSLLQRPITMIADALQQGGTVCETNKGLLPMKISGKLRSGIFHIDGSVTSQLLTGLLMALPVLDGDSVIIVENLKSTPYIDITLALLADFGIKIQNIDYHTFKINGNQRYVAVDYSVEGDWSGGAFWLVAGSIIGGIDISGLNPYSIQADKAILDALKATCARITFENELFHTEKTSIQPFAFDAVDCPDLIPVLTVLAACATGVSKIYGAQRLQYKESNRAVVLAQEFGKLGINIQIDGDCLEIEGGKIGRGIVDPHNDHRIAMTFAIAGLVSESDIRIENPQCVDKSYPNFWMDLDRIKGQLHQKKG